MHCRHPIHFANPLNCPGCVPQMSGLLEDIGSSIADAAKKVLTGSAGTVLNTKAAQDAMAAVTSATTQAAAKAAEAEVRKKVIPAFVGGLALGAGVMYLLRR